MDAAVFQPKEVRGFLVSQVGYDAGRFKQAVLRATDADWMTGSRFAILDVYNEKTYLEGDVLLWGEKWMSTWWTVDFTSLYRKGTYRIHIWRNRKELAQSDPFEISENQVWDKTVEAVAFTQFEERAAKARHGSGWKDCGSDWRECGSHTFALIGQCDLLHFGFEFMPLAEQKRLGDIIRTGCRYLCLLMEKAKSAGYPEGAIAHEIPNHAVVIPGDAASASMALGYASRLLFDWWPEECGDWLHRSRSLFDFFLSTEPWQDGGFSAMNRGLPQDFVPEGFMTRDLSMALWAGLQLYASGIVTIREKLIGLVEQILSRQITEEEAEFGFWGHFREFSGSRHSEKANTHHDVGHDTGTVLAFNVLPLMEFCQRFPGYSGTPAVRKAVENFAAHFAEPACRANPFGLLPQGVFDGEGLLDFCGPWHGTNVTYGYFASMAVRLAAFAKLPYLYEAAVGNIQWICGLHAGVTRESMAGSVIWRETIPEGQAISYSQILGVGRRCAGGWTDIRGTVVNGFATNPQFTLQVPPTQKNDGPWLFTEEDWVPHSGGFLSAVAVMRAHFSAPWNQ